jgi:hypothetical protein
VEILYNVLGKLSALPFPVVVPQLQTQALAAKDARKKDRRLGPHEVVWNIGRVIPLRTHLVGSNEHGGQGNSLGRLARPLFANVDVHGNCVARWPIAVNDGVGDAFKVDCYEKRLFLL